MKRKIVPFTTIDRTKEPEVVGSPRVDIVESCRLFASVEHASRANTFMFQRYSSTFSIQILRYDYKYLCKFVSLST